ncbi:M24 family metallopeptidase [Halomicrococcus sp. NG-SE-24]|uniref:M24 family metallopeptidase n=1 Tax=Halomicrococcus sp. NG-SE-24 TaxID=3436928 RepID=UPI003D9955FF
MTQAFEERTRRCQQRLRAVEADAVVLFPSTNLFYLSGFREDPGERHLLLFVPATGDPAFVVPEMYDEQVAEASWVDDVRTWSDGDDPRELVREAATDLAVADGRLLLDDRMWALFTQDLRAALPDADFGLASEVLAPLRARKDDAEIDALREAGRVADEVCVAVRELGEEAVGTTEAELAREIESRLADAGGEEPAFETIVGSGPNGAKPHHGHGDREIGYGDPVVLDFGAFVDGYPGDQTRTVVFAGSPPEEFDRVHRAVLEAQRAGVEAAEPGVPAEAVDRAAREVVESYGYGDRFVHRTGHGVGLDVHEEPYVVEGNETEFEPGMVFSVEPGVYLPGEFGVRIEDLVVVTEDGCERLNDSPRTWQPL